jgi:sigma-B regulation protein RsbQ
MKKVKRNDAVIDYQISGRGDFTLFFVHGSYIDQSYWRSQVDHFNQDYSVVTIDLPGHGRSQAERKHWSVKDYALDVIAVIEELALKNVILIGHSMGADVNLIVANHNPSLIIGFISIENFKNAATPVPAQHEDHVKHILRSLQVHFANTNEQYVRMALITEGTPHEISDRIVNAYRTAYEPMGLELMAEFFKLYEMERDLLPNLKFTLYLINVDYLPIDEKPLKMYAGHGYNIQHMEGTCHFPMLENPDKLNELLANTIEQITKSVARPHQYLQH